MVEITRWMAGLMGCVLLAGAAFADPTIAAMQGEKRVVLIFTAEARDPYFREQLRFLDAWKGGEERDVVAVRIVGNSVSGAGDSADSLRRRVTPNSRFMIVLLGKDGHVALRSSVPILRRSSEPVQHCSAKVDRPGFTILPGITRRERRDGRVERSGAEDRFDQPV